MHQCVFSRFVLETCGSSRFESRVWGEVLMSDDETQSFGGRLPGLREPGRSALWSTCDQEKSVHAGARTGQ